MSSVFLRTILIFCSIINYINGHSSQIFTETATVFVVVAVGQLLSLIWLMHELQHARLPCPSLYPGVCSKPCPSSWWCYPTTSASAAPFSFCLQTFLALGYFPMSWLKYWSWSFSISPSSEYSGPISFRIDRFDLLAVQETLKSLLQHDSSKASILQHSLFFIVQLSISVCDYYKNDSFY